MISVLNRPLSTNAFVMPHARSHSSQLLPNSIFSMLSVWSQSSVKFYSLSVWSHCSHFFRCTHTKFNSLSAWSHSSHLVFLLISALSLFFLPTNKDSSFAVQNRSLKPTWSCPSLNCPAIDSAFLLLLNFCLFTLSFDCLIF